MPNTSSQRAVAKPVVKRQVCYSSTPYSATHQISQPKSAARAAGRRHPNKDASHSGKRPAEASAVRRFLIIMDHDMIS